MKRFVTGLLALAPLLIGAGQARANPTYTLNSGGFDATATFTPVGGNIVEVTVTNTEGNTPDAGHAISQVVFTVGGGLALPTNFTELSSVKTWFG